MQRTDEIIIRKAKSSDVEKICFLHINIFDSKHFTTHLPIPVLKDYMAELINHNDYSYVVLSKKDHLLGYIIAGKSTDLALKIIFSEHKYPCSFWRKFLSSFSTISGESFEQENTNTLTY